MRSRTYLTATSRLVTSVASPSLGRTHDARSTTQFANMKLSRLAGQELYACLREASYREFLPRFVGERSDCTYKQKEKRDETFE